MFIGALMCVLIAGSTAYFDGYSAVVDHLNHRWSKTCSQRLRTECGKPPTTLNDLIIGPCDFHLEFIQLPPSFLPNRVLSAKCADGCLGEKCALSCRGRDCPHCDDASCLSTAFKCTEIVHEIEVLTPSGPRFFNNSAGCVCSKIPSEQRDYVPSILVGS